MIILPILSPTFCENRIKGLFHKHKKKKRFYKYFFNCSSVPSKQTSGQLKDFPVFEFHFYARFWDNDNDKIKAFQSKIKYDTLFINIHKTSLIQYYVLILWKKYQNIISF